VERLVLAPGATWQDAAERAASLLRAGLVALLPAEGVYGLHASALDPLAVERLERLKPRAAEKRYIGLIADPAEIARWTEAGPRALEIAGEHWPGALTMVLRASASIPPSLQAPDGTVALRCPGNPFLREVVARTAGIVLSTSANPPGEAPMVRPQGALAERVDLIVDQGTLSGVPSTIIAVDGNVVRVIREGTVRLTGTT
jgi:tRNA threonylcarbamoyl adenosine modification protein (Sua5/YciO/YrdC/YwlC family)